MIKSMSLRRLLTRQSSTRNPVLSHSHSIGALWKYETATPTTGRLPGKSFFHAAVRSPTNGQLPSSPGRIFGTLSDKTANAFTTTTTSQQNNFGGLVSPLSGHSQLRMFTTSSAPVSKKKTENEAEGEIASPSETPPKKFLSIHVSAIWQDIRRNVFGSLWSNYPQFVYEHSIRPTGRHVHDIAAHRYRLTGRSRRRHQPRDHQRCCLGHEGFGGTLGVVYVDETGSTHGGRVPLDGEFCHCVGCHKAHRADPVWSDGGCDASHCQIAGSPATK